MNQRRRLNPNWPFVINRRRLIFRIRIRFVFDRLLVFFGFRTLSYISLICTPLAGHGEDLWLDVRRRILR